MAACERGSAVLRYQGSEAYNWESTEREQQRQERQARPSFEVVTGDGLDARARRGIAPVVLARFKAVLVATVLLVALGAARVSLTVATVDMMQGTSELKTELSEAKTLSQELHVEQSVLSSNSRIARIVTQNYGMVLATDALTVDVSATDDADEAAAADVADATTDAAATDEAADASTGEDAAETSNQAGSDPSLG